MIDINVVNLNQLFYDWSVHANERASAWEIPYVPEKNYNRTFRINNFQSIEQIKA